MRKEILRIENVSVEYRGFFALKNFYMTVYEGESLGIVEDSEAEKNALVLLLTGKLSPVRGKITRADSDSNLVVIGDFPSTIQHMTIAENLFMVRKSRGFRHYNEKLICIEAQRMLDEFGVGLKAGEFIVNLTKTQRRMVELLKAYIQHARIILVHELLLDYSVKDQMEYVRLQQKLMDRGISFIIMDYNPDVLMRSCDTILFLKYGYNVKTYEKYDYDICIASKRKQFLDTSVSENREKREKQTLNEAREVFCVKHVSGRFLQDLSFTVHEKEIVSVSSLRKDMRTELIYFLLGRRQDYKGEIFYQNEPYEPRSICMMKKKGINVLRMQLNVDSYVLSNLSILDNIYIGSAKKISRGGVLTKTMTDVVKNEFSEDFSRYGLSMKEICRDVDSVVKWKTCLCRLELQHAKLLICEEPFAINNQEIDIMMEKFLERMRKYGTAVLLISSNDRKLAEVSDRIVRV
ncbi:MAG: ATP-binding cassette domain-containing protein [Eubacteriales bacterium]|nr:ATP-binding cassette domain-containing protein [Eubacteriales bacterium]